MKNSLLLAPNLHNTKKQALMNLNIWNWQKITSYGLSQCEKIVETLAAFNPIIVSGLAYGTDIKAHKSALNHQPQKLA